MPPLGEYHRGYKDGHDRGVRDLIDHGQRSVLLELPVSDEALGRELVRIRHELQVLDARRRVLLAWARDLQGARPYSLTWLAAYSGMSVSGVRTAYGAVHVRWIRHKLAKDAA
jgi:hypothetical protein